MSNLTINNRLQADDEFFFALRYDSTKYAWPFPFEGFALYVNGDSVPLATLVIDSKKIWNEKLDLTKLLKPGRYTLRLRTIVWEDRMNPTSAVFILKAGGVIMGGFHPRSSPPTQPTDPFPPFPEWDEYVAYWNKQNKSKTIGEYWDEWTVDYGI